PDSSQKWPFSRLPGLLAGKHPLTCWTGDTREAPMSSVAGAATAAWKLLKTHRFRTAVAIAAALGLVVPSLASGAAGSGSVRILVLSNRADLISGGDAYVRIVLPSGASFGDLAVTV